MPAGVRPRRVANSAAVDGPCLRIELLTRCRVEASASAADDPAAPVAARWVFTTSVCSYSIDTFK